jgi:short-subunit dehydrogenase
MTNRNRKRLLYSAAAGAFLAAAVPKKSRDEFFRGKTVLIAGGSRGLGLVIARELAREGALIALGARDADELERAAADIRARGAEVFTVVCDITRKEEVDRMVGAVRERFAHIDVLINNAGTIMVGPMEEMTLADYQDAMNTHFWGPLHTVLAVVPHMKSRGQGRIVNIASIGGKIAVPHLLPYSASKFALVGFSKGLRAELKSDGIAVTTVCPGLMRTGSPENAFFKGKHREEYSWFSIADSLPGLTISAETAARQVLNACRNGTAEVVLSIPAKIAVKLDALFPELTSKLLSVTSAVLPEEGGIGTGRARGRDSHSSIAPSWVTSLGQQATARNNE